MKTAKEIIEEKISKYNSNAPDIFKFQFSKKEMLIFVGAMEEYASQFKYDYSKSCKCDESPGATWCCNGCGLPTIKK